MAETFEAMESPCWDLAMSAATAGNPACAHYVKAIKKIVELYGGGVGAPLIRQQDAFAKTMGENRRLGEEFTTCIADVAFHPFEPRSRPFKSVSGWWEGRTGSGGGMGVTARGRMEAI